MARARRACSDALGALADATGVLIRNIEAARTGVECEEDYDQRHVDHLAMLASSIARLLADVRKLDEAPPAGDGTIESMTPEQRAAALRQLLAEEDAIPAPLVAAAGARMPEEWRAAVMAAWSGETDVRT